MYGYKSRNHGNVPPSDPAVTYRLMFGQPIELKAPPADGVWISVDPVSHYWYTSAQHPLYLMTYFPTAMEVSQDPDEDGKTTAHHWVQPDAIAVNTTSSDEDEPAPPEHQQWFRIVGSEGNSAADGVETAIDGLQQVWFRHDGFNYQPDGIMFVTHTSGKLTFKAIRSC